MFLERKISDLFRSFESPKRISQLLAEGFANNNTFLVGAATEELIARGEDAIIAVIIRGATSSGHFDVNSPIGCIFREVLDTAGDNFPILQAIRREMTKNPREALWVERAVADVVDPPYYFAPDDELVQWFQGWLKDDKAFASYQAPAPDNSPVISEIVDD